VPRSTLSNRLGSLADYDVIVRIPDPQRSGRHEYRLTPRGRELYLVMLSLLRFGDKHLHGGKPVPLQLTHKLCGQTFQPETACSACGEDIVATEVSFRDGPGAGLSPAPPPTQRRRRHGERRRRHDERRRRHDERRRRRRRKERRKWHKGRRWRRKERR
jgi:hypothetical protein